MRFPRYLVNFNSRELEKEYFDIIIIGSGIAGVYTALCLPDDKFNITILTKEKINISNSVLAQGGIAVSLDKSDSPELHFQDTIIAGAGLCNEETVRVLVNNASHNIENLCRYGVRFDREAEGNLSLSQEGAHSKKRIVHAGDATGKEVCDTLINAARKKDNIIIQEKVFAVDFLTQDDTCMGVLVLKNGKLALYFSDIVICASGGYGQVYYKTTNPPVTTGDGLAMAYRAGAELMDLEFVQFHPTVLFHPKNKSFLISEAVRGEGAVLRNIYGERFMPLYHELAELAPRDIVSRAIFNELKKSKSDHVYLDITFKTREYLQNRFPTIFKTCQEYGIDISKDWIPVAPAEHYCMGGIKTDAFGRTNIKGLFACGEVACNGIHGANRLASNSLLECLVFGKNIAEHITDLPKRKLSEFKFDENYQIQRQDNQLDINSIKQDIQKIMDQEVGIIRDKQGLLSAKNRVKKYLTQISFIENKTVDHLELQNIALISYLVINSALKREESRGSHFRKDFPNTDDLTWKKHIIVSKEEEIC